MLALLLEQEVNATMVNDGEIVGRGEIVFRAKRAGSVAAQAPGQVDRGLLRRMAGLMERPVGRVPDDQYLCVLSYELRRVRASERASDG